MTALDWTIFAAYLLGVLALGSMLMRRKDRRAAGEYLLAGRSMHWLPVGLSVMVTAFSALNYLAFSTEIARNGLYVALSLPVFVLVAPAITRVIMPFFYPMRLTSAYEYLSRRFDSRVRRLASAIFVLWRVAWLAVTLHALCAVLAVVTGAPFPAMVVLVGGVATLYTLVGGMRAVMWTDVLQFGVLLVGIVAGVAVCAARMPGGLVGLFHFAVDEGLTRPFQPYDPALFSLDPTVRITLPSALIGTFVAFLARYGADQVVLQRYFTARSLKDLRRSFHLNYVAAVVTLGSLAILGFAIHAFAARAGVSGKPVMVFGAFVAALPAGLTGLIVAGFVAAAMSSVDSAIHSSASAVLTDFARSGPAAAPSRQVRNARLLTLALAVAGMTAALFVGRLGPLFAQANRIINGLGAPLLAIILAGMFTRWINAPGVLVGGLLGTLTSIAVSLTVDSLSLHYYAVVNLAITLTACMVASLIASTLGHRPTRAQLSWTYAARRRATRGD
ncbi:MAG: sodium:solute symporter family transporter [Planctomycetota bacterium]